MSRFGRNEIKIMEKINNKVYLDIRNYKKRKDLSVCALALISSATESERDAIFLYLRDLYREFLAKQNYEEDFTDVLQRLYDFLFTNKNIGILLAFSSQNFRDKYINKLLDNISKKLDLVFGKNTPEKRNYLVLTKRIKEHKNFKTRSRKTAFKDGEIIKLDPVETKSLVQLCDEKFTYVRYGLHPKALDNGQHVAYLSWASKMINLGFSFLQSDATQRSEQELYYISAILPYVSEEKFSKNNIYVIKEEI